MKTKKTMIYERMTKDNHTVRRDPTRVTRWARIAREESERL